MPTGEMLERHFRALAGAHDTASYYLSARGAGRGDNWAGPHINKVKITKLGIVSDDINDIGPGLIKSPLSSIPSFMSQFVTRRPSTDSAVLHANANTTGVRWVGSNPTNHFSRSMVPQACVMTCLFQIMPAYPGADTDLGASLDTVFANKGTRGAYGDHAW